MITANFIHIDFKLNRQKGDSDAATWLPPFKSYRCTYVARQSSGKGKCNCRVTAPEAAINNLLEGCLKN
jgi:hypothetical protein